MVPAMNRFKPVLLSVAKGTGIMPFCRLLNRQRIRILAYHGVDSVRDPVVNWDDLQVHSFMCGAGGGRLSGHGFRDGSPWP